MVGRKVQTMFDKGVKVVVDKNDQVTEECFRQHKPDTIEEVEGTDNIANYNTKHSIEVDYRGRPYAQARAPTTTPTTWSGCSTVRC